MIGLTSISAVLKCTFFKSYYNSFVTGYNVIFTKASIQMGCTINILPVAVY